MRIAQLTSGKGLTYPIRQSSAVKKQCPVYVNNGQPLTSFTGANAITETLTRTNFDFRDIAILQKHVPGWLGYPKYEIEAKKVGGMIFESISGMTKVSVPGKEEGKMAEIEIRDSLGSIERRTNGAIGYLKANNPFTEQTYLEMGFVQNINTGTNAVRVKTEHLSDGRKTTTYFNDDGTERITNLFDIYGHFVSSLKPIVKIQELAQEA